MLVKGFVANDFHHSFLHIAMHSQWSLQRADHSHVNQIRNWNNYLPCAILYVKLLFFFTQNCRGGVFASFKRNAQCCWNVLYNSIRRLFHVANRVARQSHYSPPRAHL
jgi:hypothetical protein